MSPFEDLLFFPGVAWESPDIWLRPSDDGGTTHQPPTEGRDGHVYVRAHNRGLRAARDVLVRVLVARRASTELLYPEDWYSEAGEGEIEGSVLVGEARIDTLRAGETRVAGVPWVAALAPHHPSFHPCLLAEITPREGRLCDVGLGWGRDHIGQRNVTVLHGRAGERVAFSFRTGHPSTLRPFGRIVVRKPGLARSSVLSLDVGDRRLAAALRRVGPLPIRTCLAIPPYAGVAALSSTLGRPMTARGGRGYRRVGVMPPDRLGELPVANAGSAAEDWMLDRVVTGSDWAPANGALTLFHNTGTATARLPLLGAPRVRDMTLTASVPESARPGQRLRLEIVQEDEDERIVGGVTLEIHVQA